MYCRHHKRLRSNLALQLVSRPLRNADESVAADVRRRLAYLATVPFRLSTVVGLRRLPCGGLCSRLFGCRHGFFVLYHRPAFGDQPTTNKPAPIYQVLEANPADMMLNYFREQARPLPKNHAAPKSREEWERRRVELRRQLWDSLGHFPLENRPPLNARITGRIDHGDHVVEKILYESMPGLYGHGAGLRAQNASKGARRR